MNRRVLCVLSSFALAAACGGRSTEGLDEGASVVPRIPLGGSLPACGESTAGRVYYVVRDEQIVSCDGSSYRDVELDSDPSWLVSASTAPSCTHGGSALSAGPDKNANGKLDPQEIASSTTACNDEPRAGGSGGSGADESTAGAGGTQSTAGAGGTQSTAGAGGAQSAAGAAGAQSTAGAGGTGGTRPTGEDQPCTSDADCTGLEATFCDIFVTQSCLVPNCSLAPDSCSAGKECCDLSAFGFTTLCLAAGACLN